MSYQLVAIFHHYVHSVQCMIGHGFGLLEGQDEEAKIAWFTSRGVISRGAMDQSETDSVFSPNVRILRYR